MATACDGVLKGSERAREEMLERIGRARAAGMIPFPETNGPIIWPAFEIKDLLSA